MIKVAIIGFGGIAQIHRWAYHHYNKIGLPVQLVAACDANPDMFKSVTKINIPIPSEFENELPFAQYTDHKKMLEEIKPDLVDICLPTGFHEPFAVEALKQGCCVLCEKPMADTYEQCLNMIKAANENKANLMIGHCVRFYAEYIYLYNAVKQAKYGKVKKAYFSRVTPLPKWGKDNWRFKDEKAGSSMTELNVHDFDVMQYIFGYPQKLRCELESLRSINDHSVSTFCYNDFDVVIESEWQDQTGAFCASYDVEFEQGKLVFDGKEVTFEDNDGKKELISLPVQDGIVEEIGYFVKVISEGIENTTCPPDESAHAIYLLEKCFESAKNESQVLELE